ncbi:MAG: hypothetical protein HPY89_00475 [Pelotomaculum sp.]|nr:hypothetical protein [Pelotomaculum sp.]
MTVKVVLPPEGYEPKGLKQGRAWCPYCGKETEFGHDSRLDYARCMECGISERDFYVRQHNGLWPDGDLEKFTGAVKKSKRKYNMPFPWEKESSGKEERGLYELDRQPEPEEQKQEQAGMVIRACARCDKPILNVVSNRQTYCRECKREVEAEQARERKYRVRKKQVAHHSM